MAPTTITVIIPTSIVMSQETLQAIIRITQTTQTLARRHKMLNSITVIIKPSNHCNIKCSYCYVEHSESSSQISMEMLPKLIHNCVKGFSLANFVWLGGEPLLMGLDYYQEINNIQDTYRKKGIIINNSLQTNGILLNDKFLSQFQKNCFGVGISFDAPYETQIKTRTNLFSEQQWLNLFEKVKYYQPKPSFLCVITKDNIDKPNEIFDFFEKIGAYHFSLHPEIVFDKIEDQDKINESLFNLFKSIFDLWISKPFNVVKSIDPLSSMITNLCGVTNLCIFSSRCLKGLVSINPEGIVIPCSSLDTPKYYFSNVLEQKSLIEILQEKPAKQFRKEISNTINQQCKGCRYISICRNGCKSISYWSKNDKYPLCKAYMKTYDYILQKIKSY
jgi:uncharacterized protein